MICPVCGRKHKTADGYAFCKAYAKARKRYVAMWNRLVNAHDIKWRAEGSREEVGDVVSYNGKRLSVIDYFYDSIREWIWMRDNSTCQLCGKVLNYQGIDDNGLYDENLSGEVHHIIPRRDGGTEHPHNLVLLCHKCHSKTLRKERAFREVLASKKLTDY